MKSQGSSNVTTPSPEGMDIKLAAMYEETVRTRITEIGARKPKVAEFLKKVVDDMEAAHAAGQDLAPLINRAYATIDEKITDEDLKDKVMEVINDVYQGLGMAAAVAAPGSTVETGPRPMAVAPADAEEDPCASFPDGSKDIESIFAHLNDVASVEVPPFGTIALTDPRSAERQACMAVGMSQEWFDIRKDAKYIQLMNDIQGGARRVFDKDADWQRGGQRFFANFFSKHSELLPSRVRHMRENMPRARGAVSLDSVFMNKQIPNAPELVSFALLCHFSNLLQQGNLQAKAASFGLAVDRYRQETGVNRRIIDEAELARQQGKGRAEEQGIGAVAAEKEYDGDDFGQDVGQFVQEIAGAPTAADATNALQILRQFQVDVTNRIDSQLSEIESIHQKLVQAIGATAGARRQVAWTLMEPILAETKADAEMAKQKFFNSIAALLSAAQRGHALPALQWLKGKFSGATSSIQEKHGTMEAYVKVKPSQEGRSLDVVDALVRVNRVNPPSIYMDFAPGGEFYEFTRLRKVEERSRVKADRPAIVSRIKEAVDAAPPANVPVVFAQLVNTPDIAKAIRIPAKDAVQRRWTKSMEGVGNLLQQFESGVLDAQGFADAISGLQPYKNFSVADSIREVLNKATSQNGVKVHKAREKLGELSRALFTEGGSIITNKQVFILANYLNALISPKLKSVRREADVRSEIIKIARRLFLA